MEAHPDSSNGVRWVFSSVPIEEDDDHNCGFSSDSELEDGKDAEDVCILFVSQRIKASFFEKGAYEG